MLNTALSFLPSKNTPIPIKLNEATNVLEYEEQARKYDEMKIDICEWRNNATSTLYDHSAIQARIFRLKKLGEILETEEDIGQLMFFLRAGMIRNFAGITDKRLYRKAKWGTKHLVEDYVNETVHYLREIAKTKIIPKAQLRMFFRDLRKSYGTTALLLHGGTSFGLCHLGVVKTLLEIDCLPRVICGSYIGAVIAALVCAKCENELRFTLSLPIGSKDVMNIDAFTSKGASVWKSVWRKIWRFFVSGKAFDVKVLEKCIQDNIGNMTFAEAFKISDHELNILIRDDEKMLLLNHMNAPDVVIWSAACASCAVPGVYEEVRLMEKSTTTDELHVWTQNGHFNRKESWNPMVLVDNGDIKSELAELYGVNNMIVSHVPSFCSFQPNVASDEGTPWVGKTIYKWLISEFSHRYYQLKYFGLIPKYLEKWERFIVIRPEMGDVNIIPRLYLGEVRELLKNPDTQFIEYCIKKGERVAWRRAFEINMRCLIEFEINRQLVIAEAKPTFAEII